MLLGEDVVALQHDQLGAAVFPRLPLWRPAHSTPLLRLHTSCNGTQAAEQLTNWAAELGLLTNQSKSSLREDGSKFT